MRVHDYVIALDVGASKVMAARVCNQGRLEALHQQKTPVCAETGESLTCLAQIAQELMLPNRAPLALGIGVPGTVDIKAGQCWCAPNLHWHRIDVARILTSQLEIPVFLDNDANAAAVAEHRLGAGRDRTHLLVITLGTGIGSGLILGGQLYRGAHGIAGELGHVPVLGNGQVCNCGNRGCLETTFSALALAEQASHTYKRRVRARDLIDWAQDGDAQAMALLRRATSHLTQTLVGVVNLLDLELIVLGGGLASAGEIVRGPIAQTLASRVMPRPGPPIEVRLAECGPQAGVIGAGLIAWDGLLT